MPMKIAFIEYFLNLHLEGGSMFSLDLYAQKLIERGHKVSVITFQPDRNSIGSKKRYKLIEERIDERAPPLLDAEIAKLLQKYEGEFDIYHVHNPSLLIAACRYKKGGGKTPVVVDLNTYMFCTNFPLMDGECHKTCGLYTRVTHSQFPLIKKLASIPIRAYQEQYLHILGHHIERFFPVSPFAERIFAEYGLPKEKMTVIPDGFDFTHFKKARGLKKFEKGFHLVTASRFDHAKGVDVAVRAVEELKRRGITDITLHIIGNDGDRKDDIMKLVRDLTLQHNVIFHGHLAFDKLIETYARSHVFIHPARWFETFGRTVVEAMSLGLPVIVSDKGALPWTKGEGGLAFTSGNPKSLADKIEELYKSPSLREKLSKNALTRAWEFDVSNTILAFEKAYGELVK